MTQISQAGSLNTTALSVPDLYVQIVAPQQLTLNGVASNIIGVVGTAAWGPVNQAVTFGSIAQLSSVYGPVIARKFDLGTHVATACAQAAAAFVGVRVSDGTDTAATYALLYSGGQYPALLTALYTGSLGNQIGVSLASGSRAGSWKLVLAMPSLVPEVFDNIDASAGVAAFWSNLVSAVNTGTGVTRGPSQLVVASLGTGTSIPPAAISAQTLLSGTDGGDERGGRDAGRS